MFENEKSTGWSLDDFEPLERENHLDLLHDGAFALGNENQLSCFLLDDVTFEKGNKSG